MGRTGSPGIFTIISILSFGFAAWSIPSIIAAAVGDYFGPQKAASIFGFVTFVFRLGQISGPAIAGNLADTFGSFSISFGLTSFLTITAVFISSMLPSTKR